MKQEIEQAVVVAIKELFEVDLSAELTRPDEQFGDFSTNVALRLSKQVGKNPREIAEVLQQKLNEQGLETSVAGPGFLNIRLSGERLQHELSTILASHDEYGASSRYKDQVVVAEYSDPNPFKVLHAGHLYTSVVGDSIANLFETAGAQVHRVNFGGDVGLHVGKTMWAIQKRLGGENPDKLAEIAEADRSEWMAAAYIEGTNAYEDDETAKSEIIALNKRVYQLHADGDTTSPFARIYWTCRQWSYDYFDAFYARIGSKFERYYPESDTAPLGLQTVREHIGPVYKESDGAIIFDGDAHGLHTRVFINSEGLPTYEAKDVGLIMKKWADYHFDQSIVITGNDIVEYMKVVLKSIEQFQPELPARTQHLTHGIVKLEGGTKMSSRKGNFLRAVDVLDAAAEANKGVTGKHDEQVVLGAVKYAFLKPRMGGDIIYDPKESVSLQGNSGPYLQYAHARAVNILKKADNQPSDTYNGELNDSERSLVRKLTEYPEVINKALDDMLPHHVCTYLYELAQVFNRFYEQNRVIGDEHEIDRLTLVAAYVSVLRSGLKVLGIHAPDSM